jgi:hypothetical protein
LKPWKRVRSTTPATTTEITTIIRIPTKTSLTTREGITTIIIKTEINNEWDISNKRRKKTAW